MGNCFSIFINFREKRNAVFLSDEEIKKLFETKPKNNI